MDGFNGWVQCLYFLDNAARHHRLIRSKAPVELQPQCLGMVLLRLAQRRQGLRRFHCLEVVQAVGLSSIAVQVVIAHEPE